MMRLFKMVTIILVFNVLHMTTVSAQDNVKRFKIKYISANHVYLDAGSAQGIAVGDTVRIIKAGRNIALLKVVFVADNSANCEILSKEADLNKGDTAVVFIQTTAIQDSSRIVRKQRTRQFSNRTPGTRSSRTRISGYISTQFYQFMDDDNGNYDFSQPSVRLNYNARNLWDDAYFIRVRARLWQNERTRRYSENVPRSEWRNRIYELSFAYENSASALNYKFGRIISSKFSGVGYIDGGQIQHNISEKMNYGVFAGTQPEWQNSGFQTSYQKYGAFINYKQGDYTTKRFESTLALAGVYHGASISREVLFFQNNYNHGRLFNLYQSLELDINRDWRKEKIGEVVSLSGLYLNGRYFINTDMSVGLSYDNRKNYYTYELRSLADSLFDNAFRQGGRLSFSARFLKNYRIYGNAGIRTRGGSEITYSYSGGFNIRNLFKQGIAFSSRFSAFSNIYTKGINPSVDISKYFSAGHYLQVGYGNYSYTFKTNNSKRLNQFLRFNGQLELPWNFFLASDYEYSFGDDSIGHRVLAELGYRF